MARFGQLRSMASRPRSRRRLSLLARLLLAFLVPLVVVLAVVGIAATTALREELIGQVDTRLAAAVARSSRADEGAGGDGDQPPSSSPGEGDGDPDGGKPDGGPGGPDFLSTTGQGEGTLGARVVDGVSTQAAVIDARGQNRSGPTVSALSSQESLVFPSCS